MKTHAQVVTDKDMLVGNQIHLSHFIQEVGNNSCGPDSVEEFVVDIMAAMNEAFDKKEAVVLNYASIKDLIVFPNHTFSVIDTLHLKHYALVEPYGF